MLLLVSPADPPCCTTTVLLAITCAGFKKKHELREGLTSETGQAKFVDFDCSEQAQELAFRQLTRRLV